MRLLLDPTATDGGSEVTSTPPAPTTPVTPSGPDPAVLSELAAARSRLREFEAKEAQRKSDEQKAEDERRRKAGEFKEMIEARDADLATARAKAQEAEGRSKASIRTSTLATALAGHNLREGAAGDLVKLWADDFLTEADGDGWKVTAKDGRSVADVVNERLNSTRYAAFVKSDAKGGGGNQQGGGSAAPTQGKSDTPQEGTYEHYMLKARESTVPPSGHPLGNGTSRFGLKYKAG